MGSESVPAWRGNRPAEELIEAINDRFLADDGGFSDWDGAVAAADAALRAERLAVIEEIRERLADFYRRSDSSPENHPGVFAVLDRVGRKP